MYILRLVHYAVTLVFVRLVLFLVISSEKAGNCISCLQLDVGECHRLDVEKYLQVFRRHQLYHRCDSAFMAFYGYLITGSSPIVAYPTLD